ncbi:MAG: L,D-transpeptidase [Chloroflexi bacterium]|nr:L,D-transpeptidase [Chloroflexota bacterium]
MFHKSFIRIVLVLFLSLFVFASVMPAQADEPHATGKRIVVSIGQQRLYAYSGNTLVFSAAVNARGTRSGTFRIQNKITSARSIYRGWRLPYWMGIYYVGRVQNGIHGPEMLANGRTATTSLGCVVIRSAANAAWLFRWATVGTPVTVRR